VTPRWWVVSRLAVLAVAGLMWIVLVSGPLLAAAAFAGGRGLAGSGPGEFATVDGAAEHARVSARVDPALAAREVLADQDYWWKRIERRTVPATGVQAFFAAVLEFPLRLLRAIWDWIVELMRGLSGLMRGDWSGGTGLIWLIAALFLAWAIWKLYPVIAQWILDTGASSVGPNVENPSYQMLAEPSDLFRQASEAFGDRQYAEAIRLALLALIARLEKRGLLRYDTTRTNREYQMELRHASDLAAGFGKLARIYERVWYGRVPAGRDLAEQAISLCRSLSSEEDLI
jgi:hypothetical protein